VEDWYPQIAEKNWSNWQKDSPLNLSPTAGLSKNDTFQRLNNEIQHFPAKFISLGKNKHLISQIFPVTCRENGYDSFNERLERTVDMTLVI